MARTGKKAKAEAPGRQYARHALYRDLTMVYEGHSEEIPLRVPDLSARGMFINMPRALPEGAVLRVTFRLSHSGVEIVARAEVRYCLAGVGVGVEFVEISAEAQEAIEEELQLLRDYTLGDRGDVKPSASAHFRVL